MWKQESEFFLVVFGSVDGKNIELHFDHEETIRNVPLGFVGGSVVYLVQKKLECGSWSQLLLLAVYCQ